MATMHGVPAWPPSPGDAPALREVEPQSRPPWASSSQSRPRPPGKAPSAVEAKMPWKSSSSLPSEDWGSGIGDGGLEEHHPKATSEGGGSNAGATCGGGGGAARRHAPQGRWRSLPRPRQYRPHCEEETPEVTANKDCASFLTCTVRNGLDFWSQDGECFKDRAAHALGTSRQTNMGHCTARACPKSPSVG
ncbi:unnamed protein product [Miscanthus lutarioriparius]|uniref:Uncharacterized protein n=1 Tax=Miscanthus lutarioriparius TaxID=422564 RepID=A0A811SHH8_9POAL|nr:unnamed protein product [Miscanthus lutarioriparius]